MNFIFQGKKILGILAIIPSNERNFVDDMKGFNFSEARSLKLKEVMGYDRHRIAAEGTCASDLAVFGLNYLFEKEIVQAEELDALVLVTQSPDYFMPPTSNVIQGLLNLKYPP